MTFRQAAVCAAWSGVVLCSLILFARPVFANDPIVGTWKMVSISFYDLETKQVTQSWGQHPVGMSVYTPEQRFIFIMTAEGRKGAATEVERAKAWVTMASQSGTYRFEGGKYLLTVDISWDPNAVGTVLERDFKIDGDRMTLEVMIRGPASGHQIRETIEYQRVTR